MWKEQKEEYRRTHSNILKAVTEQEMGCENSTVSMVNPFPDYESLDQHARQAPESIRTTVEDIYRYLSSASTDSWGMARMIYVWITEFIRHTSDVAKVEDVDSTQEVEKILVTKAAGSTGYMKLFENLCRRAGIPVQNIQGFSKGIGHSPDSPFTVTSVPNHAWNAVYLSRKWHLVDCTWGAGHIQRDGRYKRHFEEFYFLTDPEQLIVTHYPFMNSDFGSSKRWQLLKKPLSLDEFNRRLTPYPEAFKFQVEPVSHKDAVVDITKEEKFKFTTNETSPMILMSSLWLVDNNKLIEKSNLTFDTIYMNKYSVLVHPDRCGTFQLRIFGCRNEDSGSEVEDLPLLYKYVVRCTNISEDDFEFPEVSEKALANQCLLLQPLNGKLKRGSSVNLHLKSHNLDEIMVNGQIIKGKGGEFKGSFNVDIAESAVTILGVKENCNKYIPLYGFEVV